MAVGSATGVITQQLKDAMTSTTVMNYYDPNLRTKVSVDASPVGPVAIQAQREDNSTEPRIVAYASRVLTPVESRYYEIEREALAIVWYCERYSIYTSTAVSLNERWLVKPLAAHGA